MEMRKLLKFKNKTLLIHFDCIISIALEFGNDGYVSAKLGNHKIVYWGERLLSGLPSDLVNGEQRELEVL